MSSEFTDDKFIELAEKIYGEKVKGNENFKKNDNDLAKDNYKNGIDIGDAFFKTIPDSEKENLKENEYYLKFKSELRNCYSNLAAVYLKMNNFKEIIELDKNIIYNLDNRFDKSYVRIILSYWSLNDVENSTNFYMMFIKKFSRETVQKYDEQLKPVEEKSKELLEEMKKKYQTQTPKQGGYKQYLTKIIFFVVILLAYTFGKGYLKSFWGGSKDLANDNLNMNKTENPYTKLESSDSINLDNLKEEDLLIDNDENIPESNSENNEENLNDKNSL